MPHESKFGDLLAEGRVADGKKAIVLENRISLDLLTGLVDNCYHQTGTI